jgi:hypothetical protein
MDNRDVGELLVTIGSPAALAALGLASIGTAEGKPSTLLWAIPLAIVTLPLLPFYLKGEQLLALANREEFQTRTAALPRVNLPKDFAYIEEFEGEWYVQPFNYMDEVDTFDSQAEAIVWLVDHAYKEVVALDFPTATDTYWIK